MKVLKINDGLQFQTKDGWTRSKVADLMKEPDLRKVTPRYIDRTKKRRTVENPQQDEFLDCDYYEVNFQDPFDETKLHRHQIVKI